MYSYPYLYCLDFLFDARIFVLFEEMSINNVVVSQWWKYRNKLSQSTSVSLVYKEFVSEERDTMCKNVDSMTNNVIGVIG